MTRGFAVIPLAALTAWGASAPGLAQTSAVAGGQSGYDESLEAIEPRDEPISVGLAGEDPADIGRYVLAANGGAGAGRLSPDGRRVAFAWSITGERQLWVTEAEGGQPTRLTYGDGVTFFRWSPDGRTLLYGGDDDGNEQEAYHRIAADGSGESVVLPAEAGVFRAFGDIAEDGDTIVYSSTARNGLDFDVYTARLGTGAPRRVYEGRFGFFAGAISPDGERALVLESVGEDSNALHLLELKTGKLSTLSAPERRAAHGSAVWTADSAGFYLTSNRDRDLSAVMHYDLARGQLESVEEADHEIDAVHLCGTGQRYLVWTTNQGGYSRLFARDRVDSRAVEVPDLPEGVFGISCARESDRVLVNVNGWRTPGSLVLWDMASGEVHDTFRAGLAGLDRSRLVRPEDVRIPARDGVELQGLLYLPDAGSRRGSGPPPVVFLVHGGPSGQSRPTFDPTVQYLVDRGLAAFEPNVRGSTGFGHTYGALDDRERRLDSIRDLVDMLDWLERDGRVDTSRAAVAGGSYGGYAVNAVLAGFPGRFAAGVALFGVADWVAALEIASPALKASDRIEYGDITEERWRAFYEANSPIRQADRITVPVLYSHGVRDPRVDIGETETMVRTLRANGVRADYIRFPDEGHGWRRLSNQLFYARRQAEFLEEVLGIGGPAR